MLISPSGNASEKLSMIDVVQRLGIAYHFERDIDDVLQKLDHQDGSSIDDNDLFTVALRFRLLRQHGKNISCHIFNKFKDDQGKFKEFLVNDISSLLSLYEASHLRTRGEDVLDEALEFTTVNLKAKVNQASPQFTQQIICALNRPIRKTLQRVEVRRYIETYSRDVQQNETLLKFAKLDFNILQAQHQKELCNITEWWKKLNVAKKLSYARDRIVELYFWTAGVYFEPQYSVARKLLTKVIAMISIIDDTFDAYGKYEELELFTTAIERWDTSAMEILPEYMKVVYGALLDVYKEIEIEISKEGRSYCLGYGIESMKKTVRAYLVEAKWRDEGYVPTFEKYMQISLETSGYEMLETHSFLGMGQIANKQAFDWISSVPKIVKASQIICRLMDDIVSPEIEQKRKHVATGIECYMKQYEVSKGHVIRLFEEEISNAWKDVNEECLNSIMPMPLLERILNFCCVIDLLYKEGDCYTNSHQTKHHITTLLVNPIDLL